MGIVFDEVVGTVAPAPATTESPSEPPSTQPPAPPEPERLTRALHRVRRLRLRRRAT
ncbi:MAG: hypothetical protein H6739_35375 [Alphaproteobacteria bacterium]|nr:hypothetical protein [Alphaproteobacteria bacterium]